MFHIEIQSSEEAIENKSIVMHMTVFRSLPIKMIPNMYIKYTFIVKKNGRNRIGY